MAMPLPLLPRALRASRIAFYATAAVEESAGFGGSLGRALKLLAVVAPKSGRGGRRRETHLHLMQGFVPELGKVESLPEVGNHGSSFHQSRVFLLIDMLREGVRPQLFVLLGALGGCGVSRAACTAMQIHCYVVKACLWMSVSVGSCLVGVYAKCGLLEDAQLVFDQMPLKNVVSWTALISGFVQHFQVEACFALYSRMSGAAMGPNEFTFSSLLSGCTGSGFLGMGMSIHCQVVQMGFCSYLHVSNALVSMYAKCGLIEEAGRVFHGMVWRDKVSWNSMIGGYAHHGLVDKAVESFKDMERHGVLPDAISFLGILSSCRHAGLLEQGLFYFNLMAAQGIEPKLDHYSCMVDLYGRCGRLDDALNLIKNMPMRPNSVIWGSLLSSCRHFGEVSMGILAAENRLLLEPDCSTTHVQLVSLYASVGCWDKVARVRKLMKSQCLKLSTGCSWIEIGNDVYQFRAEDCSGNSRNEGLAVIDTLARHMRCLSSVPTFDTFFYN